MEWGSFALGAASGIGALIAVAIVATHLEESKKAANLELENAIDRRIQYHTSLCKIVDWDSFSTFSKNVRDRLDKVDPPKRRKGDKK